MRCVVRNIIGLSFLSSLPTVGMTHAYIVRVTNGAIFMWVFVFFMSLCLCLSDLVEVFAF